MTQMLQSRRIFWCLTMPVFALVFVMQVVGTRLLLWPSSIAYDARANKMVVYRSYPMSDWSPVRRPWIRYVQAVHPITKTTNGGYSCVEDNGRGMRYIHDSQEGFGSWSMEWADDCLADPKGWKYEATWQGLLFDMWPMRPVSITLLHFNN